MAKRIVNKAERNAERYDAKETGYRLFEDSQNGKTFDRLMPLILSLIHISSPRDRSLSRMPSSA